MFSFFCKWNNSRNPFLSFWQIPAPSKCPPAAPTPKTQHHGNLWPPGPLQTAHHGPPIGSPSHPGSSYTEGAITTIDLPHVLGPRPTGAAPLRTSCNHNFLEFRWYSPFIYHIIYLPLLFAKKGCSLSIWCIICIKATSLQSQFILYDSSPVDVCPNYHSLMMRSSIAL